MRRLARISAILVVTFLLSYAALYIFRIAAGRILQPEDFGYFMFLWGTSGVLASLSILGMETGAAREIARRIAEGHTYKDIVGAATLASILFSVFLSLLTGIQELLIIVPFYALFLLYTGILRGSGRFRERALADVVRAAVLLISSLYVIYNPSLYVAVLLFSLSFIFPLLLEILVEPPGIPSLRTVIEIVRSSISYLLMSVSFRIMQWTDLILVNVLLGSLKTAIYGAASTVVGIFAVIYNVAGYVSLQRLTIYYEKGMLKDMFEFFRRVNKWVLLVSLPLILLLLIYPSTVIEMLFGRYGEGGTALIILSLSLLVQQLGGILGTLYTAVGRPDMWNRAAIIAAILNVVLNMVFIPIWGLVGAAIATGISIALRTLLAVLGIYNMWKELPLDKGSLFVIISFILTVVADRTFLSPFPPLQEAIISLLLYGVLLVVLRAFDREDIRIARELIHGR